MFKNGDIVTIEWNKDKLYRATIKGASIKEANFKSNTEEDDVSYIVEWIDAPFQTPWSCTLLPSKMNDVIKLF